LNLTGQLVGQPEIDGLQSHEKVGNLASLTQSMEGKHKEIPRSLMPRLFAENFA